MSMMSVIAGKVSSIVAKKFGTMVIQKWTALRAETFFAGFIESLEEEGQLGVELSEVDEKLDKILNDENKSEALYDAYRMVCFSKSKDLGPRIIGLLTGKIVAESRKASDDEEVIFRAAEILSDYDMIEFYKEYRKQIAKAKKCKDEEKDPHISYGQLIVPWHEEVRDSAWSHTMSRPIDVSQLDFNEVFGPWGDNVSRIGLLTSKVTEKIVEYREDGERHIDEDGTLTIYSWTIYFSEASEQLASLLERSLGADE